ncbi:hypothetical protein PV04_05957 [Phialophora macrospora]|uniref:Uncharacterized protein n=1 Tax=Phialophora macrospora TaxID=1851006 RepID=A0A0D2CN58_9EURO|nr:hypothetical protein PV04_05957 [Phialophora macrospora]
MRREIEDSSDRSLEARSFWKSAALETLPGFKMQHNIDLEDMFDVLKPLSQPLNIDRSTYSPQGNLLGLRAIRNWRMAWIQFMMHGEALEQQRARVDKGRPILALYMRSTIHDTSTTLEDGVTSQATTQRAENNQVINHLDNKRKSDMVLHTRDLPSSP